jgi:monoamine oxidase
LAQRLGERLETGTVLEAIRGMPDGRYRVSLRVRGGRSVERTDERVLLTLPFSVLREIRLEVELPPAKWRAIQTLGYGTNAKLLTAYTEAVWRTRYHARAETYTDLGFQNTWKASAQRRVPGPAVVTNFTGGHHGLAIAFGPPEPQADVLVHALDRVFPGVAQVRRGPAVRTNWIADPFSRGSYACYLVGQWTRVRGAEGERVGNLYFAGEHTSLDYQGYMEGACESGEAAASAILDDLGIQPLAVGAIQAN